ncbi:acetoacetate decarboxylase family protein [Spirillospora sp. NPDC048911]|uniref:acetoacetate decarboxylase family protein n=1 Tax=Spirillospora sp. NPDC048911 TaxID=3364527 RepID=UPI00371D99E3
MSVQDGGDAAGFRFVPDRIYRMPVLFGPTPGPRQRLDDSRWHGAPSPLQTTVWADFPAEPGKLEAFLPEGFRLDGEPTVRVRFRYLSRIAWLAGRGYNILDLAVPVTYEGRQERVSGDLVLVLWESLADPIISGREELGYAKLYAEIPPMRGAAENGHVAAHASWDGFTFAELAIDGIGAPERIGAPEAPGSGDADAPLLHVKYVPSTTNPGTPDAHYVTVTPPDYPKRRVLDRRSGSRATVTFTAGDFDRLPTLHHITGPLAGLGLSETSACGVLTTLGGKDLSDQYTAI